METIKKGNISKTNATPLHVHLSHQVPGMFHPSLIMLSSNACFIADTSWIITSAVLKRNDPDTSLLLSVRAPFFDIQEEAFCGLMSKCGSVPPDRLLRFCDTRHDRQM